MKKRVYTDFAWECLRRNPQYISDWEAAMLKEGRRVSDISDSVVKTQNVLDLEAEKKWGLMKYVDPNNPDPIDVFWSPRLSKRSIRLALSTYGDFTWGSITCKPEVHQRTLQLMDDTLCIKIFNNNNYFQFFADGGITLNENSNLFLYIPLSLKTNTISRNIDIIKSIINNRCETDEKEKHCLDLLKAIDDRNQGLTHKDIASEIFGEERVRNEWSSDSWLRANIRYRLKKANDLITSGYLNYL
ncbi:MULTISPECIES: DNA -binding domain-containing protein [unclassified Serratia (in: enterobacteria)]|uniref:DNA -binding domain-containing protein n=1 Tax=unclassified Serratia (in: enterobacteria) TaxID=2647522 RepID=UPI00050802A8|nr:MULTISPECIES: DUF2285 domain-containing protein [unclassified Serratia (in: enterobacteria)]KFK95544.1 hypothetical protein JV45_07230 [Serratia sp. Ag2]KFL00442.1 hypothetical protein IV04_03090 [Serratia sp. Ag1]